MSEEQNNELDRELEDLKALLQDADEDPTDYSLEDILAETAAMAPEPEPEEGPTPEEKKKRTRRSVIYYILMAVFVGVFIYSAVYIADYVVDSINRNGFYDDIASQVEQLRGEHAATDPSENTLPGGETLPSGATEPSAGGILPEYKALYEMNSDMVGWIKIEGTNVDYPVMQSPNRVDYYLNHGFDKEWSAGGCIYAREQCDVFAPSDNVVLYGHSMADLSMFQNIKKYRHKSFWEEHQYIQFDTIYERHTYQVIACFTTSANVTEDWFPYHTFNNASNEAEFNKFMDTVHSLEFYSTGLTAEYGDMLITLSTCDYIEYTNGRLVVIAKRIS